MIITRTPLRVSFLGGGSDLPQFWRDGDGVGAVISATIDKYIYIAVNDKFDGKVRVSYSVTENVDRPMDLDHDLVREALAMIGLPFGKRGVEIVSVGDVPAGSGLGSSGAYAVGLLNALYAHRGVRVGAERLGREACRLEIERCGRLVGYQDQYAAALGGLNYIQFGPRGAVDVRPVRCPAETVEQLERQLLLLHLGSERKGADEVLRSYEIDQGVLEGLATLASWMAGRLEAGELDGFGAALSKGWRLKRRLSGSVSTDRINALLHGALELGAEGGKVCGAGGGGFLLLYAPEERHGAIVQGLGLRRVPFRFERQGSRVIYDDH